MHKASNKEGLYDIDLSVRGKYDNEIQIRPLQCKGLWMPISNQVLFKELAIHLLSEFFIIRIPSEDGKFIELVAKIKTTGMPANRDEAIYQSIVTKKEELLDYVAFMLSDRPSEFFFEQQMMKENGKYAEGTVSHKLTMPLYEQLLKTASTNPEQITEVMKFIKKMKKDIVPEELTEILQMFQNVSKQLMSL